MKIFIVLMLLIGLLTSCHDEGITIIPSNSPTLVSFKMGQERTIKLEGKSPSTLTIRFTDIREGRCSGDQCRTCYGGYAFTYFEMQSSTAKDSLVLHRISCVSVSTPSFDNPVIDRKTVQGLQIGLATISDNQSDKNKYTAQLLIEEL